MCACVYNMHLYCLVHVILLLKYGCQNERKELKEQRKARKWEKMILHESKWEGTSGYEIKRERNCKKKIFFEWLKNETETETETKRVWERERVSEAIGLEATNKLHNQKVLDLFNKICVHTSCTFECVGIFSICIFYLLFSFISRQCDLKQCFFHFQFNLYPFSTPMYCV